MPRLATARCLLKTVDVEYRRSAQDLSVHQLWDRGLSAKQSYGWANSRKLHLVLWRRWLRLLKRDAKLQ